ncbi:MAG TPA: hypothetical protein VIJ12_03790 [Candidatus Baltobacteraceae bacterium]
MSINISRRAALALTVVALVGSTLAAPALAAPTQNYSLTMRNLTPYYVTVKIEAHDGTPVASIVLNPKGQSSIHNEGRLVLVAEVSMSDRIVTARSYTVEATRRIPKTVSLEQSGNSFTWK